MKRRTVAGIALFLFVALVTFGRASTLEAHAQLVRSVPPENAVLTSAPAEIQLVFSEEPELKSTEVSVLDQGGGHVENHDLHRHTNNTIGLTVPDLPDGTYTVVWKTVSAVDGHPTAGTFAFGINVAPASPAGSGAAPMELNGPPRWLTVATRLLTYIPMFVLLGAIAFPLLVLGPVVRRRPLDEGAMRAGGSAASTVLGVGATLLLTGTLLTIFLQSWSSAGGGAVSRVLGSELRTVIGHTRFGHVWAARAAMSAIAFFAALAFARAWGDSLTSKRPTARAAVFLLVVLALPLTVSLNSHSAASQDLTRLTTAIDWLHLVVAGLWIGGLVQFVVVVPAMMRSLDHDDRTSLLADAIPRFSAVAIGSVMALVATGVFQWWMLVGDLADTLHSAYGQAIVLKVALLSLLLGLGALNLLVLGPGLRRRVRGACGGVASAPTDLVRRFGLAVSAEIVVAVCVIGAAAFLTTGSPPFHLAAGGASTAGSGAIVQRQSAGDIDITLSVDPGKAGPNVIDFLLKEPPSPASPIERFVVRFTYLDDRLGTTEDDAAAIHPDHYELTGSQLSLPGRWKLEVIVRRKGLEDVRTSFEVPVAPAAAPAGSPVASPTPSTLPPPVGQLLRIGASNSLSFDQTELQASTGAISIEFSNTDPRVSHNFHLFRGGDASGMSVGATSLARGPDVQRLDIALNEPGTYYYVCDVHPDMHGVLTVEAR